MKISASVQDIKELERILIGSLGLRRGVIVAHEGERTEKSPVGRSRFYVRRYRVALDMGKRVFQSRWAAITFEYDERCNTANIYIPFGQLQDLLKRFPSFEEPVRDLRYQHYRRYNEGGTMNEAHNDGEDKKGAAHVIDTSRGESPEVQPRGGSV